MSNKIGTAGRLLWLKSIAGAILCHSFAGKAIGRTWRNLIPTRGSWIETPMDGDPRVNAMLFWGMYESAEIRFVRRYLGDDLDVVELGSSLGGVSCEIAKKLAGRRKLICIEANSQVFPLLQRNVTRNAPAGQAACFVWGAVDYSGCSEVELSVGDSNLSSKLGGAAAQNLVVPVVTLSAILAKSNVGDYALVADIEGAEAGLFFHDAPALARCYKIVIELHSTVYEEKNYSVDDLIALIENSTDMTLSDRYGPVCLFQRKNSNISAVENESS